MSFGTVPRPYSETDLFEERKKELLRLVYYQTIQFRKRFEDIEDSIQQEYQGLRNHQESTVYKNNRGDFTDSTAELLGRCICRSERNFRSRSPCVKHTENETKSQCTSCSFHPDHSKEVAFNEKEFETLDVYLNEIEIPAIAYRCGCAFFVYILLWLIYEMFLSTNMSTTNINEIIC